MSERIKRWINAALRPAGVQMVASDQDERLALVRLLERHQIAHIIDVGANRGQFARQMLDKSYRGRIMCCEPLSEAHEYLTRRFARNNRMEIMPRTAIGAADGSVLINIAGNSVSSSARDMLASHKTAAPRSAYVGQESAPLGTLDSLFAGRTQMFAEGVLLKIDTQGSEADVLAGAEVILPQCKAVLIELSTTPLYEGQALWDQLHGTLSAAGFELWNLLPDFRDPATGRLLQFDGLYLRG